MAYCMYWAIYMKDNTVVIAGKMGGGAYREGTSQGYMQEGQMPGGMNYTQPGTSALQMVGIMCYWQNMLKAVDV